MDNSIIQRIQTFKDWFQDYNDKFVIIGGTYTLKMFCQSIKKARIRGPF